MSTSERQSDRLPEQAEALLDGWPAPARSALEWEDLGNATVSRVRETTVGSTGDELLRPPLPKEEGEGELSDQPLPERDMPADEPRLLAIAKAAVAGGVGEDAKDIARAGLMAAEHSKQSHPPAPPVRAAGQLRHGSPESAAGLQGAMPKSSTRPDPVQAIHEAQARSELPPRSKRGAETVGVGVIIAGGMLALAAGVALYVAVHRGDASSLIATTLHEAAQAPAALQPPSQSAEATEAPRANEPSAQPKTLALDDLKPSEAAAGEPESSKVVVPTAGSTMSLALRKNANPAGKKGGATNLAGEGEQQGVTLTEDKAAPAPASNAAPTGEAEKQALPSRPSVGAIQGAVGAVMLGARSCLAGQETGSKATVTFGADGRVKSVNVAGPAAGTPAEGCVRSALMGARVSPFSEPEYSASFTVRPP